MKRSFFGFDEINVFSDTSFIMYMCLFIYLFTILVYRPINKVTNERQVTVTVTNKGIKNDLKDGKYLIFSKDEAGEMQVLEITDSVLRFRFDSSDLYGKIEIGKTYRFTVCGSRVQIFSWYPNIYEFEEIAK